MKWIEIGFLSDVQETEQPIVFRIGDHKIHAKRYKDNQWIDYGPEDQNDEYPFEENQRFMFEIERVFTGYKVYINDEFFHKYHFHFENELNRFLKINGEGKFAINLIEFEKIEENSIRNE